MFKHNPWRQLRALAGVDVSWPLLTAELGRTDGLSRIEIDRRLGQAERRCVLTHELVHLEHGHGCRQPPSVERLVRVEAARRLIPLPALTTALAYSTSLEYAAWDLWVTGEVLEDRLDTLSKAEVQAVEDATAHHREWA